MSTTEGQEATETTIQCYLWFFAIGWRTRPSFSHPAKGTTVVVGVLIKIILGNFFFFKPTYRLHKMIPKTGSGRF
jgi:hypothetical protein